MSAPPNFNRLARIYRWMELASFGPWLWWCRCTFLDSLPGCRRALVIGDGDGRFTARLLRANPAVQIDAVDASTAMLASLLRRAGSDTYRVRTYCADARQWQPLVWCLYWAFGHLTGLTLRELPDHRTALRQSGFALQKHRTRLGGLLVSELWSVNAASTPAQIEP